MRRREFGLTLLCAAAVWPSCGSAQQGGRVHRIGMLFPAGAQPGSDDLTQALAQLGYVAGRNVIYEVRAAGDASERLPQLAREIVASKPAVIVSATDTAARALVHETREIPIVLALIGDPVALGFTESTARPTGNVTGFTTGHDTVAVKRIELLRELLPTARKVALLWVPSNAQHRIVVERTTEAAAKLGLELLSLPVATAEDLTGAIQKAEDEGAKGLLVAADLLTVRNRQSIIDQCLLRDLPAIHNYSLEVRDGALMSYGSDVGEDYTRAAEYVDRILKGAKVAELPFREPTHFSLTINLRTARSMGLNVPPSILLRADHVME